MENTVYVGGNLGDNPEVMYSQKGKAITNFSIAINSYKKENQPLWKKITCFGNLAEFVGNNIAKGDYVYIKGRLAEYEWETKEGEKRKNEYIIATRVKIIKSKKIA